jgi:hypothetical protein
MKKLFLLLPLFFAACAPQQPTRIMSPVTDLSAPIAPGSARITRKNPDNDKWIATIEGDKRRFVCRPLACPTPSVVNTTVFPSPTRNPDPAALRRIASDDIPARTKVLNEQNPNSKVTLLSSRHTTLKGRPAIYTEYQVDNTGGRLYSIVTTLYIANIIVRYDSTSKEKAVATANLNAFLNALTIEMGPPLPKQ